MAPLPVTLHPNAASLYAARVGELEAALSEPDLIAEATQTTRSLVQQIVLTPDTDAPNGLSVDMHGDLALILNLAAGYPATEHRQEPSGASKKRKTPENGCFQESIGVGCGDRI